jgi:hypothetical protein
VGESLEILGFSHVGFAVWSIEDFQESWGTALGISDWIVADGGAPGGFQLHGEVVEGQTAARTAFAKIGGTCLELIQPVENRMHHREHLDAVGPSVHHLAFWVEDLPTQLARLGSGDWEIAYSPTTLVPGLSGRPISATGASPTGWDTDIEYPPFFSFLEHRRAGIRCALELIDANYAANYRDAYGDHTYYPGDLPQ